MASKTKEARTPRQFARVVIEEVRPQVDCGRFPIKRVIGERVEVTADIHADGHDVLFAVLQYRSSSQKQWQEVKMEPLVNDRWTGGFSVSAQGRYFYTVSAWTDRFPSWSRDLRKKFDAGQDITLDILVGVNLITEAAERAAGTDGERLSSWGAELSTGREKDPQLALEAAQDPDLVELMQRHAD